MKQCFILVCLIISNIIGAGFATGKEIYIFFTRFGSVSFVNIILACILFYKFINLYLTKGKTHCPKNIYQANIIMFGKYNTQFGMFYFLCYLIVISAMFAGVTELCNLLFNRQIANVLSVLTAVVCLVVSVGGIKKINTINSWFLPITVLLLILCAIFNIKGISLNINNTNNVFYSIFSVISYVGINTLLCANLLLLVGKDYSIKIIKVSAFVSVLILGVIISLFNIVMLNGVSNINMPMISLALKVNTTFGLLVMFGVWFCICSTITYYTYILAQYIRIKSGKTHIKNALIIFVAYVISLFGFDKIITFLYPIIGVVGIVFTIILKYKTQPLCAMQKR